MIIGLYRNDNYHSSFTGRLETQRMKKANYNAFKKLVLRESKALKFRWLAIRREKIRLYFVITASVKSTKRQDLTLSLNVNKPFWEGQCGAEFHQTHHGPVSPSHSCAASSVWHPQLRTPLLATRCMWLNCSAWWCFYSTANLWLLILAQCLYIYVNTGKH